MEKILFSLTSNKALTNKIAHEYHISLGKVFQQDFLDGEMLVKSLSEVKDKHAIIIQSTSKPVCINLFKILLLVDSIHRMGVGKISLVIPYLGFSRQERVADKNEPVSAQVAAQVLNSSHVDEIITFDLHHPIIKDFFNDNFKPLKTTEIFGEYYKAYLANNHIDLKDVVVVAPDHGANERATLLRNYLNILNPVVILNKHRPQPNKSEVLGMDGDVKNKVCIIIDDIIDTGGTIINGAKLLFSKGATKILVGATHGVFSNNAAKKLHEAKLDDIACCNTIEKRYSKYVNVLDIKDLLMKNI